ncbi:sensor histidine kinase [Heyndrickxia oleronia]|jgi:signal transduction histidine kinase|uniref:sensor histidine kinase n=1 Tax=Heyndrickxia oleronia TaxID=38875 RepID=UPI00242FAD89|nr:HAMP domain-containing sensor histidine kinase [Heyndrickxia oleronia]MCI1612554.1 cell wall metabolism sensor histidine kinase WalK [Heyndrickxia oleronia]MCI1743781.1 cell wall metabolism sensor histidine kinase WalK [Heyndrickxia oleronia]MCI1760491.1 cell wall metabolism sensor histidine kinase WalK [Heyndrickxia oleronia]
MKIGIVSKLFMLTTTLCMLILVTIFIGQTIFFKQYYANQKVNKIETGIQSFTKDYLKAGEDVPAIQKLQQDFYQENTTWITTLDSVGNIRYTNDFSVDIHLDPPLDKNFSNRVMNIPLYSFIGLEDLQRVRYDLEQGNSILIDGVQKNDTVIPSILTVENNNVVLENVQLSEKLYGKRDAKDPKGSSQIFLKGVINKLQIPEGTIGSNIYTNRVLIDRIKQFQVNLIINENRYSKAEIMDYEENNIHYKIFISPIKDMNGETTYIFAMTSLQPVDEAVQMLGGYYIYLIIFVLLLIVLASFYFSKKIAKPLLQINDTTYKIANLDFSETIPITSKDEIGTLSYNINTLSNTLHSYINQLQEDIEKEKQLENTRKEFISGVSHELKTPLSIMKSCISILEDGVAKDKKDYYFKAMTKEVDKMDMLIVDMLELAKFESGTYKMKMEVFFIDQVIEYICEQLAIDITNKQIQVYKQLSKIQVVANQHRIEQVITNFITNAIRYTPEHQSMMVSAIEENERVKVCVENKGAHISEKHLEKIWDRFYRGDTSRQRSKGGTGLGLAISKNILELHDSEYGAKNTEDGVLFYFYLNKKV